jgi:hypothetical protein
MLFGSKKKAYLAIGLGPRRNAFNKRLTCRSIRAPGASINHAAISLSQLGG